MRFFTPTGLSVACGILTLLASCHAKPDEAKGGEKGKDGVVIITTKK